MTPTVGTKVRVLDTEWGRAIQAVDEVLEVVGVPQALDTTTTVRVEFGGERPLLINDSIDTEFEVVS